METESVSEVSGPHDMKAVEKKIIISWRVAGANFKPWYQISI